MPLSLGRCWPIPVSRNLIGDKMGPGKPFTVNSYPDWRQFASLFAAKSFLVDGTDPSTERAEESVAPACCPVLRSLARWRVPVILTFV